MSYYSRPSFITKFFRFATQTVCLVLQFALLYTFFMGATVLDGWSVDLETAIDYVTGIGNAFSSQFYYSASRVAHGVMYIVFLVKGVITFIRSFRYLSVKKGGNAYAMNRSLGLILYYFIAYLLLTHMLNPTQISWDGEEMLTTGVVLFLLTRVIAWITQGDFDFGYIFKMTLRLVGSAVIMYALLDALWVLPLYTFGQMIAYSDIAFIEFAVFALHTVLWVILITTALRALRFWVGGVGKNPQAMWKTLRRTAMILLFANILSPIIMDDYSADGLSTLFGGPGSAILIFVLALFGKFLFVHKNASYASSSSSSSSSSYSRSGGKGVFGAIFGGIATVFGAIWKGIVAVFSAIWKGIAAVFIFIGRIFAAIGKGIAAVFKWIWEKIDDLIYDIKYRRRNKNTKKTYNAYKSKAKPTARASATTRYKKKENKFVAFFVRIKDGIVYGAVAVFDFFADKFGRLKKGKHKTSSTPKVHAPKKKAVKPAPVKPSYPLGPIFELNAGDIFGVEIIEEV